MPVETSALPADRLSPCVFPDADLLDPDRTYTVFEVARLLQDLEADADLPVDTERVLLDWAVPWILATDPAATVADPRAGYDRLQPVGLPDRVPGPALPDGRAYTVYELARLLQNLEADAELASNTEAVLLDWAVPWAVLRGTDVPVVDPRESVVGLVPWTGPAPSELLDDRLYTVYEIGRLLGGLDPGADLEPGAERVLLDWAIPWVVAHADALVVADPRDPDEPGRYGLR